MADQPTLTQLPILPHYNTKTPPCSAGCFCAEDIRGYLTLIAQADEYGRTHQRATTMAFERLVQKNPLPATLGRVCPHPCETACNRGAKDEPVAIHLVEKGIGDFALTNKLPLPAGTAPKTGKQVAVIGSGPAGLSAAYQLNLLGHQVTLMDQMAEAGGMLRWGIPNYRLPEAVLAQEIQRIFDLGVTFKPNFQIGRDQSLEALTANYDAVFVAIGAGQGRQLPLEGSDGPGVMTGVQFLLDHKQGNLPPVPDKVIVIGGGDVAFDVARSCIRLGAKQVQLLCREPRELMPATTEEIEQGTEEGIALHPGMSPKSFLNSGGALSGMEFIQVTAGEPEPSGWRGFTEVPGTETCFEAALVVTAISQSPDYSGLDELSQEDGWTTQVGPHGSLNENGNLWVGGDIVRRLGLVNQAIGDGYKAAQEINSFLRGESYSAPIPAPVVSHENMRLDFYYSTPQNQIQALPPEQRVQNFEPYQTGFDDNTLLFEACRCMSCGGCFDCDTCLRVCGDQAVAKLPRGQHYAFDWDKCTGCSKCAEQCPCNLIDML